MRNTEPEIRYVPLSTILGTILIAVGCLGLLTGLASLIIWLLISDFSPEPILDGKVPRELVSSNGPLELKEGKFGDGVYWIDGAAENEQRSPLSSENFLR